MDQDHQTKFELSSNFIMPRFFRRRYLKIRPRWSRENTTIRATSPETAFQTFGTNIVPSSSVQGMRTVGNFAVTLTAGSTTSSGDGAAPIYWALVYVPQGQTTNILNTSDGDSLYEPNQYVLACGVNDPTAGPIRIRSSMKRKLNSGDFISLLLSTSSTSTLYVGTVSYSVKYN